jgi:hypothetical protein
LGEFYPKIYALVFSLDEIKMAIILCVCASLKDNVGMAKLYEGKEPEKSSREAHR